MALQSDITIDASKFDPKSITDLTHTLNGRLMDMMDGAPKWYEVLLSSSCPEESTHCPNNVFAGWCREIPGNAYKRRDTVPNAGSG